MSLSIPLNPGSLGYEETNRLLRYLMKCGIKFNEIPNFIGILKKSTSKKMRKVTHDAKLINRKNETDVIKKTSMCDDKGKSYFSNNFLDKISNTKRNVILTFNAVSNPEKMIAFGKDYFQDLKEKIEKAEEPKNEQIKQIDKKKNEFLEKVKELENEWNIQIRKLHTIMTNNQISCQPIVENSFWSNDDDFPFDNDPYSSDEIIDNDNENIF